MPPAEDSDAARLRARRSLRESLLATFGQVLWESGLSPIAVMTLAAEALGSCYCEVAAAHRGPSACDCGWRPRPEHDLAALQAGLAAAAAPRDEEEQDLRLRPAMGHA